MTPADLFALLTNTYTFVLCNFSGTLTVVRFKISEFSSFKVKCCFSQGSKNPKSSVIELKNGFLLNITSRSIL